MRFDIFSLFPEMFRGAFDDSIIRRARTSGLVEVFIHDIRASTSDKHHSTDDLPYGGGGGMLLMPEPVFSAVERALADAGDDAPSIVLLSPQGRVFTQAIAQQFAQHKRLALICGRYEGVDERVREHLATDEISIGDYVLTGGEIPAMVIVDAVTRLLPGALGDPDAPAKDSHVGGLLEGAQYTRPAEFRGWRVPDVLLSGHHAQITKWRRQQSLRRTLERRPELLRAAQLDEADRQYLQSLGWKE